MYSSRLVVLTSRVRYACVTGDPVRRGVAPLLDIAIHWRLGSGERLHWACEAFLAAVLALPRAPTRWFFWLVLFLTPAGGKQR